MSHSLLTLLYVTLTDKPTLCHTNTALSIDHYNCTDQEFMCNNGKCISVEYVCDGDPDCFTLEDESMAICQRKYNVLLTGVKPVNSLYFLFLKYLS